MERHLIVVQPFGDFAHGARIKDPETIAKVLAESADKVIAVDFTPDISPEQ